MNTRLRIFAVCATTLLWLSSYSVADLYKHVDEKGNVTYTDTQRKDSEKVDLPPVNTQPAQPILPPPPKKQVGPVRMQVWLTSPTPDQQIGPAFKTLTLSLGSNRELLGDELFQYFINGAAVSLPTRKTSITVGPLKRGRNSATVKVVLPNGSAVATSPAITYYVIRP